MAARVLQVAKDGSGQYQTVQEAIDAIPLSNPYRIIIRIAPGVYKQPVYIPKTKNLITFAGLRPEDTVLTWDNIATKIDHHQSSRVIGTGTFGCGSTIVEANLPPQLLTTSYSKDSSSSRRKRWSDLIGNISEQDDYNLKKV